MRRKVRAFIKCVQLVFGVVLDDRQAVARYEVLDGRMKANKTNLYTEILRDLT